MIARIVPKFPLIAATMLNILRRKSMSFRRTFISTAFSTPFEVISCIFIMLVEKARVEYFRSFKLEGCISSDKPSLALLPSSIGHSGGLS
eukprot:213598-Hanusia_phi.AAC.3